jgi:DNA (cytosine-5)-methyltransferase 1
MQSPRVFELFSGCGGMSWGLHKAGFEVIAGLDNSAKALQTFKENHPDALTICKDITTVNAKDIRLQLDVERGELDCIVGGPPCQGFSKNVPASRRFLDDPKNQLFREFLHFVDHFRPKSMVMENVPPIYTAYDGTVKNEICGALEDMGYEVSVSVLYAPDYGVPQRRRRCFFLGSRQGSPPSFPKPTHQKDAQDDLFGERKAYVSAWEAISDLPSIENGGGQNVMDYASEPQNGFQSLMRQNSDKVRDHVAKDLSDKQYRRVCSLEPGEAMNDLPEDLQPKSGYSGAYGRLDFQMLAPTITRWVFHPGSGRFFHPRDKRLITMREAARLQSFTDDFRLTGSYNDKAGQIGNAVPPLLMKSVGKSILNTLKVKSK